MWAWALSSFLHCISSTVIATSDYLILMPDCVVDRVESAQTPWGKADVRSFLARSSSGITYIFLAFDFATSTAITANSLVEAKTYFLRNKKCTARELPWPAVRTADGKAWPQTYFGGTCAAPGEYLVLTLIAHGRLYQLQVSNDPQMLRSESLKYSISPAEKRPTPEQLAGAIEWLAGRCLLKARTPL
jgi:hypothetical protein